MSEPSIGNDYRIEDVVRRRMGDVVYYFGSLRNDVIKHLTQVLVVEKSADTYLEETTEGGYQRPASAKRQREIGDYLVEHPSALIPPVLINAAGQWVFEAHNPQRPDLGVLRVRGKAHIIDGQHRLGGFIYAWEDLQHSRTADFIAYENLSLEREKYEFNLINTKQKGVPKSISAYITREEEAKNWIAWEFNQREDSPFHGRISRVGKLSGEMLFNLHSIAKNVGRTLDHPNLEGIDKETAVEYLIKYWSIIRDTLEEQWEDYSRPKDEWQYKLLELTGVIAWSLIGPAILGRAYDPASETMNWEMVEKMVARIDEEELDWAKDGKYKGLTGEVGGKEIMRDMLAIIDRPAA